MQLFILTAALFAGLTFSQNLSQIAALPPCGQTCINNMLGMAASLGCPTTDYKCLCNNMNFGYGVRDCSTSVCAAAKPPVDPTNIISVGNNFCSEVNAAGATGSTTTLAQTVLTGTTAVTGSPSGMTSMPMATGSSGSGSGNGTSSGSTNGTSGGLLGGNVVTTLTNSLGSTTTSTISSSSSSGPSSSSSSSSSSGASTTSSSSSSGTGTATGATSPTASTKSEAGHVAAGGFVALAGLAAWALL